MAKKIDIDDLFDFNDPKGLEKITTALNKAGAAFEKAAKNIQGSSKIIVKSLDDIEKEAKETQDPKRIIELAEKTELLAKENEQLKKSYGELSETAKKLKDQESKLVQGKKKLIEAERQQAGSIKDLKLKTKEARIAFEAMGKSVNATVRKQALNNFKKLQTELQKTNKATREGVTVTTRAANTFRTWEDAVASASNKLKNISDPLGKGATAVKRLTKTINDNKKKLREFDASIGNFQRNVGNYGNALKRLGGSFKSVAKNALATIGAVTLLPRAFSSITDTVIGFEKALSNLSAITGATGKDLDFFSEAAREIGKTTTLSATQAVEAFKLIGSAKPELLKSKEALVEVTNAAATLAEASGLELPEAATALTDTLNQFNLTGAESARVMNVLAAGSKAGAAEIPDIKEAITKFGLAASSSNISLEESVGLIETLAEKGLKGAEAGTKLRNVLGKLAGVKGLPKQALDQLEKFGVNLDIVSDSSIPVAERLREISKVVKDPVALMKIFGEQNKIAAQAILENVDSLEKYTEAVTGTNVANEQAAINTDNISGSISKLGSAWEDVVLGFSSGNSAIKGALDFITNNLRIILTVLATAIGLFGAYRAIIALNTLATNLFSKAQKGQLLIQRILSKEGKIALVLGKAQLIATKAFTVAKELLTNGTKRAALAQRALNAITRAASGPLAIMTAAIGLAYAAYKFLSKNANEATKSQINFAKSLDSISEAADKSVKSVKDLGSAQDQQIKKLIAAGATEEEIQAEKIKNQEKSLKLIDDEITKIEDLNKTRLQQLVDNRALQKELGITKAFFEKGLEGTKSGSILDVLSDPTSVIDRVNEARELNRLPTRPELDQLQTTGFVTARDVGEFDPFTFSVGRSTEIVNASAKQIEELKKQREQLLKSNEVAEIESFVDSSARIEAKIEKDRQEFKLAQLKRLQDNIAFIKLQIIASEEGSKERLNLEKSLVDAETRLRLKQADDLGKNEIALLKAQGEERKKELEKSFSDDLLKSRLEANRKFFDEQRAITSTAFSDQEKAAIEQGESIEEIEEEKAQKLLEIQIAQLRTSLAITKAAGKEGLKLQAQLAEAEKKLSNEIRNEAIARLENEFNKEETARDIFAQKRRISQKEQFAEGNGLFKDEADFNRQILDDEISQLEDEIAAKMKLEEEFAKFDKKLAEKTAQEILDLKEAKLDLEIQKEKENQARLEEIRLQQLNSPIANALFDRLEKRFLKEAELLEKKAESADTEEEKQILLAKAAEERRKAETKLAAVQAFRASIQEGKTVQESVQDALIAVAALTIVQGFADGGYTGSGGKHEVAGHVHKDEFVLTKAETSKLGLRGKTMNNFKEMYGSEAVHSDMFVTAAGDLETNIVAGQNIDYDKLGKKVAQYASNDNLTPTLLGETQLLRQSVKGLERRIYKSSNNGI